MFIYFRAISSVLSALDTFSFLFLSANNLFTLTGYKGYDPEVASGVDAGAYPTARTYTVGANISF